VYKIWKKITLRDKTIWFAVDIKTVRSL
jgi:hypothetical protein